jgi:hypothetical protein
MKSALAALLPVALFSFFSTSAFAQSAKFAATWNTDDVTVAANASCDSDPETEDIPDCPDEESQNLIAQAEMATIHIGSHKSILVGVSSQIGIHLLTIAKGKGGSTVEDVTSTARAEGDVGLGLTLVASNGNMCQTIAPSDSITLKKEIRELQVGATSTADEVEVMVGIDTMSESAHHFEFLGVECPQGTYTLTATFDLTALARAAGYDATAAATVTLGDRMVTLQEVRAVKGSFAELLD